MMLFFTILLALVIGSVGSVLLAGTLLLFKGDRLERVSTNLISLAGGTLLGAAFLGMLPKAFAMLETQMVLIITLLGILVFFALEKIILWRICNDEKCERHKSASAQLILFGDAFHNFIDGVIITAAFLTSIPFGIFVTLTVLFHEIPQELADFGILLKNGFSKKRALLLNMLSGSSAIPGGIIAYFALESVQKLIPWVLAFSAASFIYIALADLVPAMHKKTKLKDSLVQFVLIISGILIIYFIKQV